MADITVTCTQCNATLKVSEYVDIDALKCRGCGAKMEKPDTAGGEGAMDTPAIRLAAPKAPEKPVEVTAAEIAAMERNRKVRSFFPKLLTRPAKPSRRRRRGPVSVIRYWIIFIVTLLVSAALRWGDIVSQQSTLDIMIQIMLIYFGMLHVGLVAQAFHDDVFQGILCVFIPFYSVYYMLRQSDSLVLRSISAALLLTFGYDLMVFLTKTGADIYDFVNRWIMSGAA